MSVTRRFYWLSFGLLLVSFALGSCARSGLNEETQNYAAYQSAVAKLVEKTADLSCTADSDCQFYSDPAPCSVQSAKYSLKNISTQEVISLVDEVREANPNEICTLAYMLPFDDNHCVNSVCEFRVKNFPF